MESTTFEQLVADAIDSLPAEFLEKLNNVSVVVEDFPTPYQQQKMHLNQVPNGTWQLFGLYEGVPQTKRTTSYSLIPPDKITIFRIPIETFSPNEDAMKEQVRKTVLHEIGHHFGMSDAELQKIHY